ncbi:MAG: hypothetical protein KKD44_27305 [Proteobacteria bacterium]|nr:hypothetical protein [Pseudomonadota bacterium]
MALDSGRELILEAVKTQLATISQAAGYHTTPVAVLREMPPAIGELEVGQLPALYVIDGTEEREHLPCQQVTCRFHVALHGYTYEPTMGSTEINQLLRDVKKCLQEQTAINIATWESGRGTAELALLETIEMGFSRESGHAAFVADLVVRYREPLTLT